MDWMLYFFLGFILFYFWDVLAVYVGLFILLYIICKLLPILAYIFIFLLAISALLKAKEIYVEWWNENKDSNLIVDFKKWINDNFEIRWN